MWCLLIASVLLISEAYGQVPVISAGLLEARVGDNVSFFCDSRNQNGGSGILLGIKRPQDDSFSNSPDDRVQQIDDGQFSNFTYGPLTAADNSTMFRCDARGGSSLGIATIFVIFAPLITRVSPLGDPVSVREGQSVTVELNVSANPQPAYEWTFFRNGAQKVIVNDGRFTVELDSIMFNPASRNDTGLYRLLANNSAGSEKHNFTLNVQHPPEFPDEVLFPSNTFNCSFDDGVIICASYPGVTVTLVCDASGNPLPIVNRDVLVSDPANIDSTTGRDIRINSLNPNNAGEYTCTASSLQFPQATKTRRLRLYVGGVAQPLTDIRVIIGQGIVDVTWSYDNSRNPVPAQYFIATVSQMGEQIGKYSFNITTMSITIPGNLVELVDLRVGQTYMVSVVVRNLQGDSEPISEPFTLPLDFNDSALATSMSYLLGLLMLMMTLLF